MFCRRTLALRLRGWYFVVIMETTAKRSDARIEEGVGLTTKQEAFCKAFIEDDNAASAYRRTYDVGPTTKPNTVWRCATALMNHHLVTARIAFLRAEAAKQTICSLAELLRDWDDIRTADPSELVKIRVGNCRFCNGIEHKYQWRDIEEWTDACVEACAKAKKNSDPVMPDFSGGVGFRKYGVPSQLCPKCEGDGVAHAIVQDMTDLSPKARKLLALATMNRYGEIVVELHSQQDARVSIARCLGAFNDKLIIPKAPGDPGAGKIDEGVSPEQAQRMYQDMLNPPVG